MWILGSPIHLRLGRPTTITTTTATTTTRPHWQQPQSLSKFVYVNSHFQPHSFTSGSRLRLRHDTLARFLRRLSKARAFLIVVDTSRGVHGCTSSSQMLLALQKMLGLLVDCHIIRPTRYGLASCMVGWFCFCCTEVMNVTLRLPPRLFVLVCVMR
jgi:hypothetical protein